METALFVAHTSLAIFGIFSNSLLIFLCLFKAPRVFKIYSVLILSHAVTDFGTCFTDLFDQPRLIPCDKTIAVVSNGLCKYFPGPNFCFVVYSIQLHFLTHSLYLLLISFSYRLYVLHRTAPSIKALCSVIFLFYIPSLFQMIIIIVSPRTDPNRMRELILNRFPSYYFDGTVINGYEDLTQFAPFFAVLHAVFPTLPVYTVILILRKLIMVTLEKKKNHMGPETREMHSQLLKALSAQAVLPAIIALSILCFVLGQLRIINSPLLEFLTFLIVLLVPTFSPLISFIYIRPFRGAILKMLKSAGLEPRKPIRPKTSGNSLGAVP